VELLEEIMDGSASVFLPEDTLLFQPLMGDGLGVSCSA
jgi:hypothetical protein